MDIFIWVFNKTQFAWLYILCTVRFRTVTATKKEVKLKLIVKVVPLRDQSYSKYNYSKRRLAKSFMYVKIDRSNLQIYNIKYTLMADSCQQTPVNKVTYLLDRENILALIVFVSIQSSSTSNILFQRKSSYHYKNLNTSVMLVSVFIKY